MLTFLFLAIASSLVTNFAARVTHLINTDGSSIGVTAALGSQFLAMSWSAAAIMLLCRFAWHYERYRGKKVPPFLGEVNTFVGKSDDLITQM
jgi:hypothetical protein